MSNTIRREIRIPQPREQVWRAIAGSATLAEWMFPNDFEPRVGHQSPIFTSHSKIIHHPIMNPGTKRSILRCIHILFGLPILGYIYGPPSETLPYLPYFRFVYVPVLVLSGLLMWKGHVIQNFFLKNRTNSR